MSRSLSNSAWVCATEESARIRDHLETFVAARRVLHLLGVEILRWTPVALSHPLQTSVPREVLIFYSLALLTGGGLSALVAVPIALSSALLRRTVLPEREAITGLFAVLFFLPALYAPVRRCAPDLPFVSDSNLVLWIGLTVLVSTSSLLLLRRVPPTRVLRRWATGLSVVAFLAAMVTAAIASREPRTSWAGNAPLPRPNVLLISIDSLRADHVGCYGYHRATTPHLDRLAAEGARFINATAPTSWTLPSHLALLTALPAESSAENPAGLRARLSTLTLAEVLRSAGYRTAAFVGGPYLESRYGFAQGFSVYDDFTVVAGSNPESHRGVTSPELHRLAANWLEDWRSSGTGRPFFLFWHLWDVHFDYEPPPPFDSMFDPGYTGTVDGRGFLGNRDINPRMNFRDLEHVVALYDGEIAFTDAHVGKLIDILASWHVLDNTLVVVVSDHGDEFFEHGVKGHRKNLYETTLAVPLIVRWPGRVDAGRVVRPPVGLLDVAPTILSLVGVEPPPEFARVPALGARASRDLTPLLTPAEVESLDRWQTRPLFGDLHGTLGSVRWSNLKLIARFDLPSSNRIPELYDLDADPRETADLAAERPTDVRRLLGLLQAWRSTEAGNGLAGEVPRDVEHLERLRSLGYLD